MKYFYLYIFLLLLFIFSISYYNTYIHEKYNLHESFDNMSSKTIILMGDSILKNNSYVPPGKAVDNIIEKKTRANVYSLAVNDSKIVDVYAQIDKLPLAVNDKSTTLFLSIGGNDILGLFKNNEDISNYNSILTTMLKAYKKLIKSIQSRMNNVNFVLLDIYYPENIKYKQFHPIIQKWNEMLREFAADKTNNIDSVISISDFVNAPNDFTLGIEPSQIGGEKISNAIIQSVL